MPNRLSMSQQAQIGEPEASGERKLDKHAMREFATANSRINDWLGLWHRQTQLKAKPHYRLLGSILFIMGFIYKVPISF